MKKAAILLAAIAVLFLTSQAALADPRPYPPGPGKACSNPKPAEKNKNCQPANFSFPSTDKGSITVGMLIIAGLGTFTVMLAARGVRRRLISS